MHRAIALAVVVSLPGLPSLYGFAFHGNLIRESFDRVREVRRYAAADAAVNASEQLDDDGMGVERLQFQHSMRPAGVSTARARELADEFVEVELSAAVDAAFRGDKPSAGRHLGRLLHTLQDQKHNWCSCGDDSNPSDSEERCGPNCNPGFGNHGLPGCRMRLSLGNFQWLTDGAPNPSQLKAAATISDQYLNRFLDRVRNRRNP